MKIWFALLFLELRRSRWLLGLLAVMCFLFPLLVSLLPDAVLPGRRANVLDAVLVLECVACLLLLAGSVGHDAGEGTFPLLFALPVRAWKIWIFRYLFYLVLAAAYIGFAIGVWMVWQKGVFSWREYGWLLAVVGLMLFTVVFAGAILKKTDGAILAGLLLFPPALILIGGTTVLVYGAVPVWQQWPNMLFDMQKAVAGAVVMTVLFGGASLWLWCRRSAFGLVLWKPILWLAGGVTVFALTVSGASIGMVYWQIASAKTYLLAHNPDAFPEPALLRGEGKLAREAEACAASVAKTEALLRRIADGTYDLQNASLRDESSVRASLITPFLKELGKEKAPDPERIQLVLNASSALRKQFFPYWHQRQWYRLKDLTDLLLLHLPPEEQYRFAYEQLLAQWHLAATTPFKPVFFLWEEQPPTHLWGAYRDLLVRRNLLIWEKDFFDTIQACQQMDDATFTAHYRAKKDHALHPVGNAMMWMYVLRIKYPELIAAKLLEIDRNHGGRHE